MAPDTPALQPRHGILTLSGYGLRVAVERGHLTVEDGIGNKRRRGRFSRVGSNFTRLVVLGHSGVVSFDALRWLHDVGVSFAQIDADGRVIAATGPIGLNEPRLRRAQALASQNGAGLAIARDLLHEKLAGQASLLKLLGGSSEAVAGIQSAQTALKVTQSVPHLRVLEAHAAAVYWDTWRYFPVRFARRDQRQVPVHWQTVGTRSSLLTGSPRKAINPANALLNYLYAIVEAEARLAALAVGCDPGLGLLHADLRSRDSLACDLMEPVRPSVDAFVFDTLSSRVFRREELFETRDGVCRLLPPLTQSLVETASRWAKAVAPIAERVARRLADSATENLSEGRSSKSIRLPTPLTEAKRRTSQQGVSLRRVEQAQGRSGLARTCQVCGAALATARQAFCDACRPTTTEITAKGREVLRRRRAEGNDPAHGGSAAAARGSRIAETQRAIAAWEAKNQIPPDSTVYFRDVFPRLQAISVPAIVRATGLSYPYCAMIRRGLRVPHPMHWEGLLALIH